MSVYGCAEIPFGEWNEELAKKYSLPEGWLAMKSAKCVRFRNGWSGKQLDTFAKVELELGYPPKLQQLNAEKPEWSEDLAMQYSLPEGWFACRVATTAKFKNGRKGKVLNNFHEVEQVLGYRPVRVPQSAASREDMPADDSDTEVARIAFGGASGTDSYELRSCRRKAAWLILPEDVDHVELDKIGPRLEASGFKRQKQNAHRHDFSGDVDLTMFSSAGKVLVRSNDRKIAERIATLLLDVWFAEDA